MSRGIILMALVAIMFGVAAMFGLRSWLTAQQREAINRAPLSKVVVATSPIAFGVKLDRKNIQEIDWPGEMRPAGSFATIDEILSAGGKPIERHAMVPLVANEPVIASRITGPNQKATLSSMLKPGHKAVAIRVNDINGVAGFVLPGDHVDIFLTREQNLEPGDKAAFVDVLLQEIKVLAVDQRASQEVDQPKVARTVTVDVTTEQAQILTLAADVGRLSLALRNAAGVGDPAAPRRVSLSDLVKIENPDRPHIAAGPVSAPAQAAPTSAEPGSRRASVGVTRNNGRTSYDVLALQ